MEGSRFTSCAQQSKQPIPLGWEQLPDELGIGLMTREHRLRYALDRGGGRGRKEEEWKVRAISTSP